MGSNKGILGGTSCRFPGAVGAGSSLEDLPLIPSLPLAEFISSSLFSPLPVACQEGETMIHVIRFFSKCPPMIPAFCHSRPCLSYTHTGLCGVGSWEHRIADMKDCDLQDWVVKDSASVVFLPSLSYHEEFPIVSGEVYGARNWGLKTTSSEELRPAPNSHLRNLGSRSAPANLK